VNAIPDSSEISVVVQGPIVGKGDTWNGLLTQRCLQSVRKFLPKAELILSTWQGADVSGLDYDGLVHSVDPGVCVSQAPKGQNLNRLIRSTSAGMERATRSFILKIRTDIELTGTGFLTAFAQYSKKGEETFFSSRVVTWAWLTKTRGQSGIYHLSDMVHFGRREDILSLWQIPLLEKSADELEDAKKRYDDPRESFLSIVYAAPEQYLCLSWLNRHRSTSLPKHVTSEGRLEWERLLASNFVVLDVEQFSGKWKGGDRLTISAWSETCGFEEWRALYRKYCDASSPGKWLDRVYWAKLTIDLLLRRVGWLARGYSRLYHWLAPQAAGKSPMGFKAIFKAKRK